MQKHSADITNELRNMSPSPRCLVLRTACNTRLDRDYSHILRLTKTTGIASDGNLM